MRRVRYVVAMSLDGPDGAFDLRSDGSTRRRGNAGMKAVVFSRTLSASVYPAVDIVADQAEETVRALRAKPGKDIWLFGGGSLFRSLSAASLVDTGSGDHARIARRRNPLLPFPAEQVALRLIDHKAYPAGIVSLKYTVLQILDRIADKYS